MADTLRSKIIRLAAMTSDPEAQRLLLAVLDDSMDTAPSGWGTTMRMLKMKPELDKLDADAQAADNYRRQVQLLRTLQAGDVVEVTFNDVMRGGAVKTRRIVKMSWDDLKALPDMPGIAFRLPQVTLEAKVPGRFKEGRIIDYGPDRGVLWQGTMQMQVKPVLNLRKG